MSNENNLTPIQELRNTAKYNKGNLKGSSIIAKINNDSYPLQISGIGAKAIRLSLFVSYEDILKFNHNRKLEHMLYNKINTVYPKKNGGSVWRVNR